MKITPLASVPTTRPDGVALASLLFVNAPGNRLWLDGRVTSGTCSLRPYYWSDEPASDASIKGAWIPLGGDASAGLLPTSFDSSSRGGCSNGRFKVRRTPLYWVVVQEAASTPVYDFVHLTSEDTN